MLLDLHEPLELGIISLIFFSRLVIVIILVNINAKLLYLNVLNAKKNSLKL